MGHACHLLWGVCLARLQPGGGNVGAIGLQHKGLKRHLCGQAANPAGASEGHGPAEAEVYALPLVGSGLIQAPIEGVGDPAPNTKAAQASQNLILRPANVKHHGQVIVTCESKLLMKKVCHAGPIESRNKKVQSDFTDCGKASIVPDSQELSLEKIECVVS